MSKNDPQHSNGEAETVRHHDGGGETSPLPGSEAARDHEQPASTATGVARPAELWRPGKDSGEARPGSPADRAVSGAAPADAPAQPSEDPQAGGGRMPDPAAGTPKPDRGADASSHGSR